MKKIKKIVPLESPCTVYEDQRTSYRHQCLLQDYEELQKEMEVMRRKLQIMKQKKLMLSTEVRFFRQRYRYLVKNPPPKTQPEQDVLRLQNPKIEAPFIKNRKCSRKESSLRLHVASHTNAKKRKSCRVGVKVQQSAHVFDLNQNARSFSGKDASFLSSAAPLFDLNKKDRIHSGKEATKKSITPFFDLNQISREEEELMGDIEPIKGEEPKRSTQGGPSDKPHGDIKLSICRNVGNGSNRTGKRKISWQDQVALRV